MLAKVAQDGPKKGQANPRGPEKGFQTYDPHLSPMIAAGFWGHFGATSGYHRVAGAKIEVSELALRLDLVVL